jgi:hypothetical protein
MPILYAQSFLYLCVTHVSEEYCANFYINRVKLPDDKTIIDIYSRIRVVQILVRVLIIACQIDLLVLHQAVFSR